MNLLCDLGPVSTSVGDRCHCNENELVLKIQKLSEAQLQELSGDSNENDLKLNKL